MAAQRLTDALTGHIPTEHVPAAVQAVLDAFPAAGLHTLTGDLIHMPTAGVWAQAGVLSLSVRFPVEWVDGQYREARP